MNLKTLTVTCLAAMTATAATAGNIIGTVKDKATGEPLIGTVVSVKEIKDMWATTGLDGSFTLNKMPDEGRYTLIIRYMAYKTVEVTVDVADGKKLMIPLEEDTKTLGEVVIKGKQENRTDRSALLQEKNATGGGEVADGRHGGRCGGRSGRHGDERRAKPTHAASQRCSGTDRLLHAL